MKIAIASSGLGHVARGIETWALDTAVAVSDYSLQTTDDRPTQESAVCGLRSVVSPSLSVTLFSGAPLAACPFPPAVTIPCWKRSGKLAQTLARFSPPFLWRWGLKNPYGWEQFSFWLRLWPKLRRGKFDILHVQDPMVADWCRLFRKWGLVWTKEILAHGTEEPVEFLAKFEHVQHLAPWHLEKTAGRKPETGNRKPESEEERSEANGKRKVNAGWAPTDECGWTRTRPYWVAIPNFVDCEVFTPGSGKREELRKRLGIPENAFVVGCVAAVKKDHKRIDYLIREIAQSTVNSQQSTVNSQQSTVSSEQLTVNSEQRTEKGWASPAEPLSSSSSELFTVHRSPFTSFLIIAGAKTGESEELMELAESLLPGRYKILLDCARDQMPDLYRAMDVFVLPSLFEMMPIAVLEAMASGLPCVVNRHPVLEWMVGAEEITDCRQQTADQERREENTPHPNPLPQGAREQRNQELAPLPPLPSGERAGVRVSSPAAGIAIEMSREGALAQAFAEMTPDWIELRSRQARERAECLFSKETVISQYVKYYREVMG